MRRPLFRVLLLLCLLAPAAPAFSQAAFLKKVKAFKMLLTKAEGLRPFSSDDAYEKIEAANEQIGKRLQSLLADTALRRYRPDSLLAHPFLTCAVSPDRKLYIWSWYENTGGSFHSYETIVSWRRTDGSFASADGGFEGRSIDTVYALRSPGRRYYLCAGSGRGCNTCVFYFATVVELRGNTARFNEPVFLQAPEESRERSWGPSFELGARMGNVEDFGFNPKTQTLHFTYITDDNTPVKDDMQTRITRRLRFDGRKFRGDGYR